MPPEVRCLDATFWGVPNTVFSAGGTGCVGRSWRLCVCFGANIFPGTKDF